MEPNTIRLRANTWDELADEAEEQGYRNRSEYIRNLLRNRDVIAPNTGGNTGDYTRLRERVDELEARLGALEGRGAPPEGQRTSVEPDGDRGQSEPSERIHPDVREAVDRAAEWWGDDRREERREAATAVLQAIQESESGLTKTEILDRFADDLAVDGQSEDTWWRRNLAEGAEGEEAPAPLRLVATYSRGTHKWTWTGLDGE